MIDKFVLGYGVHRTDQLGRPELLISICHNDGQLMNQVYVNLAFTGYAYNEGMNEAMRVLKILNKYWTETVPAGEGTPNTVLNTQ